MIVIVGVGALGSHAALALRNVDKLKLIDFDTIEQKNVLAQFHSRMSVRHNKAQSLARNLSGIFGVKEISHIPHKLTSDNIEVLFGDADLVIDCTDNIAARDLIQHYVKENSIPCLHGALSADGAFARIIWTEIFQGDVEEEEGQATCEDGEQLPFFMSVGSFIAIEAQRFLSSGKKQSFQMTTSGIIRLA